MRSFQRLTLAVLVSACGVATAQSTLVLPRGLANGAGNSSNSFPFGTSAAGFPGLRVMSCYDSSNFTAGGLATPIRITRLRWRANDSNSSWTGGTFAQGAIRLGTAAVDHLALTTSFAQNVGPDFLTAYAGPISYLPGAGQGIGRSGPVVVDVTLTTAFVYDPMAGDLVVDVDYPGGTNFVGGTLSAMDVQTGAAASRAYASSTYPLANGTTSNHGIVVEVEYTPANGLFAAFKTDVQGGPTPLTVHFTDASYSSAGSGVTTWAWDFDNDGIVDSTLPNPTHVFTNCGRHSVSLRVTDGVNAPSTALRPDAIVTDEIAADFDYRIIGPGTVQFTDTSTPPSTTSLWDLDGDGALDASGPVVFFTYPQTNSPTTVTLSASRLCGPTSIAQKPVLPSPALLTTFAAGNGLSGTGAGNVFDVEVRNPTGINVTALTVCPLSTTLATGAPITCDVYLTPEPGGFAQNHANAAVWRRVAGGTGTFHGSSSTAIAAPTEMTLDHRFYLPAGSYSMAIHMNGCGLVYTTGSGTAPTWFGNADVQIACGLAKSAPFAVTANSPRVWNGILHYDLCSLGGLSGFGWFAPGCTSSLATVPGQSLGSLPTMGQTFAIEFTDLPHSIAFLLLGFSRTQSPLGPLPLDLGVFGAPGCRAHVSPDEARLLFGANNRAAFAAPVPLDPAFLCLPLFTQALALDPAANAGGIVATDAAAALIGN